MAADSLNYEYEYHDSGNRFSFEDFERQQTISTAAAMIQVENKLFSSDMIRYAVEIPIACEDERFHHDRYDYGYSAHSDSVDEKELKLWTLSFLHMRVEGHKIDLLSGYTNSHSVNVDDVIKKGDHPHENEDEDECVILQDGELQVTDAFCLPSHIPDSDHDDPPLSGPDFIWQCDDSQEEIIYDGNEDNHIDDGGDEVNCL